ncbi:DUF5979 domain-containing protein [Leucobacter albus]|uniref:DUF5979 domain-containing protein n=1 Tax=Leucobacter albus TaxID=272210 RepID=A0ABW3TPL4_9MICO
MEKALPHGSQSKVQAGVRRMLGALLAAVLGVMGLIALPGAATAATVGDITSVEFTNDEFAGGSRQEINVTWSVANNPTPPLSVSIDLPPELRGYTDRFPATAADGSVVGECTVTPTKITCTIDDEYVAANPLNISGSFRFLVDIRVYNTVTEEHTWEVGGVTTPPVTVTPNPGVCESDCEYKGTWGWKHGNYNNIDDVIDWTVGVRAEDPNGLVAGKNVTVTDFLDLSIFEVIGTPVVEEAGAVRVNPQTNREEPVWKQMPADLVTIAPDNLSVSFTSRAGVSGGELRPGDKELTGAFYVVKWKTKVLDEGEAGTYTNEAEWVIEGVDSHTHQGTVVRQSGSGTVVGTNHGKFAVTKQLVGNADLIDPPAFTLNWVAYASDDDTTGTPGSATIRAGETFTSPEFFKGTRVVLTEVTPTEPANVAWSAPKFVATDAQGNPLPGAQPTETLDITFARAAGNLARVSFFTLTNEATLVAAPIHAKKVVENPDGLDLSAIPSYTLNYSYPAGEHWAAGSGSVALPADGTVVATELLPIGAKVTFAEAEPAAIAGGHWHDPQFSATTVTVGSGEALDVSVTNTITRSVPPVSPPKSGIAHTGGSPLQPLGVATVALLIAAGATLAIRGARRAGAER